MTERAPGSTVQRMVENAMNIMNIEVETGWDPDEIIDLAKENGYGLNVANGRFQKVAKPKPVPMGIVRTSQAAGTTPTVVLAHNDTGAESAEPTGTAGVGAPPVSASDTPLSDAAPAPVSPDHTQAVVTFIGQIMNALADLSTALTGSATPAPPRAVRAVPTSGEATAAQMRDWARTVGLRVNPRGSVSREVRDAYAAAHRDGAA